MLKVKVHYGLGNQMFQYAFGRAFSHEKKTPLLLDISFYENQRNPNQTDREFQLNVFNIQNCTISRKNQNPNNSFIKRQLNKLTRPLPVQIREYYREKEDTYDPDVFKCNKNVYLFGYWQDERYFKKYESIIRNDFSFKLPADNINQQYLKQIANSNSVCIHVRRTDYITDNNHFQNVGVCSLEYYRNAINYVSKIVINPHFFVFSDDPNWTKENLIIKGNTTYITHNNIHKGYEDLRLMMNCKYFIIANSSFSWWGAWLSTFPEKIVIAPKRWQLKNNEKRSLPVSWIRM